MGSYKRLYIAFYYFAVPTVKSDVTLARFSKKEEFFIVFLSSPIKMVDKTLYFKTHF